jgi:hypothetical protein
MNISDAYKMMDKLTPFMGKVTEPFNLPVYNIQVDPVNMGDFIDFSIKTKERRRKELSQSYEGEFTLIVLFKNNENSGVLETQKFIPINYKLFINYNDLDISL